MPGRRARKKVKNTVDNAPLPKLYSVQPESGLPGTINQKSSEIVNERTPGSICDDPEQESRRRSRSSHVGKVDSLRVSSIRAKRHEAQRPSRKSEPTFLQACCPWFFGTRRRRTHDEDPYIPNANQKFDNTAQKTVSNILRRAELIPEKRISDGDEVFVNLNDVTARDSFKGNNNIHNIDKGLQDTERLGEKNLDARPSQMITETTMELDAESDDSITRRPGDRPIYFKRQLKPRSTPGDASTSVSSRSWNDLTKISVSTNEDSIHFHEPESETLNFQDAPQPNHFTGILPVEIGDEIPMSLVAKTPELKQVFKIEPRKGSGYANEFELQNAIVVDIDINAEKESDYTGEKPYKAPKLVEVNSSKVQERAPPNLTKLAKESSKIFNDYDSSLVIELSKIPSASPEITEISPNASPTRKKPRNSQEYEHGEIGHIKCRLCSKSSTPDIEEEDVGKTAVFPECGTSKAVIAETSHYANINVTATQGATYNGNKIKSPGASKTVNPTTPKYTPIIIPVASPRRSDTFSKPTEKVNSIPAPPPAHIGLNKGFVWENNSCYVDATLFSMFYGTETFEGILEENDRGQYVRKILKKIVTLLKDEHFCESLVVRELRKHLGKVNPKLISGFADPEEFLYTLLEDVLEVEPFIYYVGGISDIVHMITLDTNGNSNTTCATTQQLLEMSMNENQLMFETTPYSALILQLPRCDGILQRYQYVIPSLDLDLSKFLPALDLGSNEHLMSLASVICFRHQHYTCFHKCHGGWVYFDSMYGYGNSMVDDADIIEPHLEAMQTGVVREMKELPLMAMRIISDAYICIYIPKVIHTAV